jgi:sucrose phosphorylase
LSDDQVDDLVETIHGKTGGASRRASGHAASNLDIYQVNSTYYDALGGDDSDYLIARAIQFFAPGTPQIYYVGLLAGENDLDLVEKTGVGRDINRHYYAPDEVCVALERSVVQRLVELIRLRNALPAFGGTFSLPECPRGQLIMRWDHNDEYAELRVDLSLRRATISYGVSEEKRLFDICEKAHA